MRRENFSERMTPEAFKVMSILVLGTGTGMLSASFSPVITLIVVAAFAITSVTMYAGLLSRPRVLAETDLSETITSNRMLFFFMLDIIFSVNHHSQIRENSVERPSDNCKFVHFMFICCMGNHDALF